MMKIKKLKMSKFLAMTTVFIAVIIGDALAQCVSENRHVTDVVAKSAKIYDIWTTDIEFIPWLVEIFMIRRNMKRVRYGCSGGIISRHWIVSAGHCFGPRVPREVRAGTTDLIDGGSIHNILRSTLHPKMNRLKGRWINNIAVAKVEEPFDLGGTCKAVPLSMTNIEKLKGSLATISGWGLTKKESPNLLQSFTVPILGVDECRRLMDVKPMVNTGMLCAGYEEGDKSLCSGKAGGPLIVDGFLVGIGSSEIGCSLPPPPGVYADVAYFHNWITQEARD